MALSRSIRKEAIKRILLGTDNFLYAWLEVIGISLLSVLIWRYQLSLNYEQPTSFFYWSILGPVLVALRYGFGRGLISLFILLVISVIWINVENMQANVSLSVAIGAALITMLVGEFRDGWNKKVERDALNYRFMELRMDSFTQSYHLLKISHDLLEERLVGQQVSLRTAVQTIQQVAGKQTEADAEVGRYSLNILAEVITLFSAGFYKVSDKGQRFELMTKLGEHSELYLDDPMLEDAMINKITVAVADYADADYADDGAGDTLKYQLVIPLVDVLGNIKGIVAAEKVRFVHLTESNIALVHLIASYIANFISREALTPILEPDQRQVFIAHLKAQRHYFEHYKVDSSLVIFNDVSEKQTVDLEHATDFRRGADVYWLTRSQKGQKALCVLLPMASPVEAERFVERIKVILERGSPKKPVDLEVFGPLLVNLHHQQLLNLLESFGAFDEDLADSINTYQ